MKRRRYIRGSVILGIKYSSDNSDLETDIHTLRLSQGLSQPPRLALDSYHPISQNQKILGLVRI